MILLTGGAGFIGANFILDWFTVTNEMILNLDALTYAGNLQNLSSLKGNPCHQFIHGDICNRALVDSLLIQHHPRAIIHFAAETHVDRSIQNPSVFIKSNLEGTFILLEAAYSYWKNLQGSERQNFRFIHISTDEVYGSLSPNDPPFTEHQAYKPNSPYSASKAASDHLVRAWHQTYGLPVIITHCSNNYGPYQFTEKLIPLMITRALSANTLPIYGDGLNIRDWLYVSDHCSAIRRVLTAGQPGETYNIGGWNEITNLDIVRIICCLLDELQPHPSGKYERLITFVPDRPGHDQRYAIDARKMATELDWRPAETFTTGIRKTVQWYTEKVRHSLETVAEV